MQLFLIRHGESTNNALTDWKERVEDPLLTERGVRQAELAARYLAAHLHLNPAERDAAKPALNELYCSAMIRALQTAHTIGSVLERPPEVWIDIHEIGGVYLDHGETKVGYPGRTRRELAERFPGCLLAPEVTENGWWNRDFEAEHPAHERAIAVARALRARAHQDVRVGLVSHGDFLSALLKALGDQHPREGVYYEHRNTGITYIDLMPHGARVRYLNRVDHLDESLLTY